MSIELKIKSKHLSEEAKIIRFEERKQLRYINKKLPSLPEDKASSAYFREWYALHSIYNNLRNHRIFDVRRENRATFLARAYLSGKAYSEVESSRKPEKEFEFQTLVLPRVLAMVNKYRKYNMPIIDRATLDKWINAKATQ
jgi:hypothetical protein